MTKHTLKTFDQHFAIFQTWTTDDLKKASEPQNTSSWTFKEVRNAVKNLREGGFTTARLAGKGINRDHLENVYHRADSYRKMVIKEVLKNRMEEDNSEFEQAMSKIASIEYTGENPKVFVIMLGLKNERSGKHVGLWVDATLNLTKLNNKIYEVDNILGLKSGYEGYQIGAIANWGRSTEMVKSAIGRRVTREFWDKLRMKAINKIA